MNRKHEACKFNSSRFYMMKKEERREREEGGLLGASTYIIKQTKHIDIGLYTGLTLQARAGVHTMAGDFIYTNGRK